MNIVGKSRRISIVSFLEEICFNLLASHLAESFDRPIVVVLPKGKALVPRFCSPDLVFDENEAAAAAQAFQRGEAAGRGTGNIPTASAYYLPLRTWRGTEGVLGIVAREPDEWTRPGPRDLLETFANQAAISIARGRLEEEAQQVEILRETGRIQKTLLNSVSHNLRTPLSSIIGSLTSLAEAPYEPDPGTQRELVDTALGEARRLNRLVGNLLDMARLESGSFQIKSEPCDVEDVIGAALAQLGAALRGRPVAVRLPPGLPMVPMDFVLITQVLVNVVENAVKYSPPASPVELEAQHCGEHVAVSVKDRGRGIAEEELTQVFDRFHRGRQSGGIAGLGLGLSISKGFIEAHRGRIWAERGPGGGTVVTFHLPINAGGRILE